MKTDKGGVASGIMFAGFGIAALALGRNLSIGTAARMGPGYFPYALGVMLIVLGAIITWRALAANRIEFRPVAWRPMLTITAALILFAQLLGSLGLVVALVVLGLVSRVARPEYAWRETVLLSLVITVACVCIFYFGLGIQLPLWPTVDRG